MSEPWITTFTGKKFYPTTCKPDDICIEDIAHSLSRTCRYNGHCKIFYSVAEHSVRLAQLAPDHLKIHALLHDAPEALTGCGDVCSRMKHELFPEIGDLEDTLLTKIYRRFGVPFIEGSEELELSRLENSLLAVEVRDLMPKDCLDYWYLPEPPVPNYYIIPWKAVPADYMFLNDFKRLTDD